MVNLEQEEQLQIGLKMLLESLISFYYLARVSDD